jgi:hypothetical protein
MTAPNLPLYIKYWFYMTIANYANHFTISFIDLKWKTNYVLVFSGLYVDIQIRAATNDYFNNRLIGRLFYRLIDESDKKNNEWIAASLFKNGTLLQIHSADWSVKTPGYCSNVPQLLKVRLNDKKIRKQQKQKKHAMFDIHLYIYTVYKGCPWITGQPIRSLTGK